MASSGKPPVPEKGKKSQAAKELKFLWTPTVLKQFLDLLIGYQRKYGRDQGFSWVVLTTQFEELTGQTCGGNTLKNKYATMKEKWKAWKELKHGETGLEWDYERGCIDASDEWWERKCQEKEDFRKLKNKCIPPDLEDAWDQIYGGTVATGQHCVSPSMDPVQSPVPLSATPDDGSYIHRPIPTAGEVDLGADVDNIDEFDLRRFPDLVRGASQSTPVPPVQPAPIVTPGCSTFPTRSGKCPSSSSAAPLGKKRSGRRSSGSVMFDRQMEFVEETSAQILNYVRAEDEVSRTEANREVEVMKVLDHLVAEGLIEDESPLLMFAIESLITPERARMFLATTRSDAVRLAWLKYQYRKTGGDV